MYHFELLLSVGCATCSLYASPSPKSQVVPNYNHRGSTGIRPLRRFMQGLSYSLKTALLARVQRLRNDQYNAVKRQSTRHIVLSLIAWSYCQIRYVNAIWLKSWNITTQPGEINYRTSKVIPFVVNAGVNITTSNLYILSKKDVSLFEVFALFNWFRSSLGYISGICSANSG